MTVRAIAYLSGWDSSAVTSASYTITGTIADPVISPAAGTYTSARTVSISCSSAGAVIRYTVDGSLPTESSGTVYSASFTVSSDTVVNAIAYRTGWETSGITTVEYIITGTVDAPVFSPGEGTYITEQLVSIS